MDNHEELSLDSTLDEAIETLTNQEDISDVSRQQIIGWLRVLKYYREDLRRERKEDFEDSFVAQPVQDQQQIIKISGIKAWWYNHILSPMEDFYFILDSKCRYSLRGLIITHIIYLVIITIFVIILIKTR